MVRSRSRTGDGSSAGSRRPGGAAARTREGPRRRPRGPSHGCAARAARRSADEHDLARAHFAAHLQAGEVDPALDAPPVGAGAVQTSTWEPAGKVKQAGRSLLHERFPAGSHVLVWDGTGADGRRVQGGVYFTRLKVGGDVRSRQIVLVR